MEGQWVNGGMLILINIRHGDILNWSSKWCTGTIHPNTTDFHDDTLSINCHVPGWCQGAALDICSHLRTHHARSWGANPRRMCSQWAWCIRCLSGSYSAWINWAQIELPVLTVGMRGTKPIMRGNCSLYVNWEPTHVTVLMLGAVGTNPRNGANNDRGGHSISLAIKKEFPKLWDPILFIDVWCQNMPARERPEVWVRPKSTSSWLRLCLIFILYFLIFISFGFCFLPKYPSKILSLFRIYYESLISLILTRSF